jgi:hypothetical protein
VFTNRKKACNNGINRINHSAKNRKVHHYANA